MKKIYNCLFALLFSAVMVVALTSCEQPRPVLQVFNWANYMDPDLIAAFEEEFGCRVVIDTFDSNEAMLAKLQSGADDYDVVFPSSYMAAAMQSQGMLRPINHELIPNLQHIDRGLLNQFAIDVEMAYSVPYMLSTTGIGYQSRRIQEPEESWAFFQRDDLQKRATLLNDKRETLGAALKMLGFSLNSTNPEEINQARDLVLLWKAQISKFDSETYIAGLATGEVTGAMGYSGDVFQAQEENSDVEFFIPHEGASVAIDDMVILTSGKEPDLAHAFINFFHDPANAALNMETTYYLCPNQSCYELVDAELRENENIFVSAEILARCEVVTELAPDATALYDRAWDEVLAR